MPGGSLGIPGLMVMGMPPRVSSNVDLLSHTFATEMSVIATGPFGFGLSTSYVAKAVEFPSFDRATVPALVYFLGEVLWPSASAFAYK